MMWLCVSLMDNVYGLETGNKTPIQWQMCLYVLSETRDIAVH